MTAPQKPMDQITQLVDLVINSAQNVIHAGDSGVDVRQSILEGDRERLLIVIGNHLVSRYFQGVAEVKSPDRLPGELITNGHRLAAPKN